LGVDECSLKAQITLARMTDLNRNIFINSTTASSEAIKESSCATGAFNGATGERAFVLSEMGFQEIFGLIIRIKFICINTL